MATIYGTSGNDDLAATPENDKIYGCEGDDTLKKKHGLHPIVTSERPDKKLILQSLVCNSTAAGTGLPDQVSVKVEDKDVWNYSMNAGDQANLSSVNEIFHEKVYIELFAGFTSLDGRYISNSGNGSGSVPFTKGKASYMLTYQIIYITL